MYFPCLALWAITSDSVGRQSVIHYRVGGSCPHVEVPLSKALNPNLRLMKCVWEKMLSGFGQMWTVNTGINADWMFVWSMCCGSPIEEYKNKRYSASKSPAF